MSRREGWKRRDVDPGSPIITTVEIRIDETVRLADANNSIRTEGGTVSNLPELRGVCGPEKKLFDRRTDRSGGRQNPAVF